MVSSDVYIYTYVGVHNNTVHYITILNEYATADIAHNQENAQKSPEPFLMRSGVYGRDYFAVGQFFSCHITKYAVCSLTCI